MQSRTYFLQDPTTRLALAGASVNVYQNRTTTPVTVYSPSTGSPLGQPLIADTTGKVSFAAADGLYTIVGTLNGATVQLDDVEFFDYASNRNEVVAISAAIQAVIGTVTQIGTPGTQGFGVGSCASLPTGFAALAGSTALGSDDYGNYRYSDGSMMVWIPAFYYRIGNANNPTYGTYGVNSVDIKDYSAYSSVAAANSAGYALHRAFYDGGVIKSGFFIDKYGCSNNGGIASSIALGKPLSTASDHNPLAGLVNTPANTYYGTIDAAKSRGSSFFPAALYQFRALALLALAHAQAATASTYCAWYDAAGVINFPKGNNNNAFKDANDTSVTFTSDGYASGNSALCGSGVPFAKTTHNGQNCGVADLNGNLYGCAPIGLTSDGTNYYVLNTSVAAASLTSGASSAADVWGATSLAANYTNIGATYGQALASNTPKTMGSTSQVFSGSVSAAVAGYGWYADALGLPLAVGGSNQFGNDGFYDYRPNQMCPISGFYWSTGSYAGVWALNLHVYRGTSTNYVGFRAALYP